MSSATIIVADDEERQRATLARALEASGYRVLPVSGGEAAVAATLHEPVDIVITDLRMPGVSGLDVVRRIREAQPDVAVVVVTAYGTVAAAVQAMKAGAADFLMKPIDLDSLELVVARLVERRDLVRENRALRRRLESTDGFRLLGQSASLLEVLSRASRSADTDATVLIRGESGTGKELLARSIHSLSRRSEGPFVAINCAALPETLLESELFGYERGAFTGAAARHLGRIEQANGGTLFLDEIGDVPASVQVKLLRFLQEHEYSRLGGGETLRADLRIITATHRDLEKLIAEERFREDLYYRLNVVGLLIPPLRQRREDIPELIEHFLAQYAKRYDRPVRQLTHEASDALMKYAYPGNVRELENIIEQATVLAGASSITLADLPASVRSGGAPAASGALSPGEVRGNLGELLEEIERRVVLETLSMHDGNQSSTARHLGLTEGGLRYKLLKWTRDVS
jgi:DNA-binding NtrC family response regulator